MEAQAWTAIGLLAATLFGALAYIGNRIDGLGARLDGRLDAVTSEIRSQAARIDGLSSRMDAVARRVEEQGTLLADRIYEVAIKLD